MSLGRPHLPPPVLQDPMGPCGILQLQRPHPVGLPCLLARGLTRTKGLLSSASSHRDCSGPALLTLPSQEKQLCVCLVSSSFSQKGPQPLASMGVGWLSIAPFWVLLPRCPQGMCPGSWPRSCACPAAGPGLPLLTQQSLTFSLGRRYSGLQLLRGHTGCVHPQPGSGEGVQEARDR